MGFQLPDGIYGITAEALSKGRKNAEVVRQMIAGGVGTVQYREKDGKSISEQYEECLEIRKMTRDAGVLFIVNDHVDLALAIDADGVHIGQNDMPLKVVRKLAGKRIIGISVQDKEQAKKAIRDGADYIGIGPVFSTDTKKDAGEPLGLDLLEFAARELKAPFVAIGGIKSSNLKEVSRRGTRTVAIVSEIVGADDIAGKVRELRELMTK
jgi:thiamine-phosphate pyrophosphorylase